MDVKVKDENAVELTDGAKAIGFVRSTEGATVVVISADGSIRELNPGDPIFEGDILQVTDGSSIALAFADGSVRQLSSGEAFQLSQGNFDQLTLLEGFDETENPEFQDLLAALSAGEDISEDQEATAAGESGAGGGELGGGLLFSLIGSEVTPTAGIDPDYIPPPLLDPTADTDVNQEVSRRVDLGASGLVTVNADAIPENEEIVYTVQVDEAPVGSDLILTLTNGVQITILEGQNSGTSSPQPAQGDDVYKDGETFNVGIQSSSGGGYDTLNISDTTSVTIVDTIDASVVTITVVDAAGDVIADPSTIVEGTTAFFRYSVDNPPETDLTLTTTDLGNVIITAAGPGYTDVAVPNRADDRYDQGPDETTADVLTWSGGNYEDLTHTSTADATIVDDNDASTVTLTATASVDVGGLITYTATVVNTPVSTPLVITIQDENNVTLGNITINPGEFEGTLEVAAPGEADVSYDVTILSATGGTYEALDITDGASTVVSGIPASTAMITNTNVGIQEVRITVASNEGSNSTGVVDPTEVQGQEGSALKFDDDVFFKPGNYTVTIEHVTGDPVILTDLSITDSNANELLIYEGNAKLETGDTRGNTNPDGYIFNVVIGPDFGSDATDFTVSEPIGFEVLGGILTLDTASGNDDFTLDFSELSINGGQDLFGYVDTIDISGKGTGEDNTIFLSAQDVIDLGTGGDIEINIIGDDADDVVNLVDGDAYADTVWQKVGSTDQYDFVDTGNGDFVLATVLADGNVVVNIT